MSLKATLEALQSLKDTVKPTEEVLRVRSLVLLVQLGSSPRPMAATARRRWRQLKTRQGTFKLII
jgi:hypothetical protein